MKQLKYFITTLNGQYLFIGFFALAAHLLFAYYAFHYSYSKSQIFSINLEEPPSNIGIKKVMFHQNGTQYKQFKKITDTGRHHKDLSDKKFESSEYSQDKQAENENEIKGGGEEHSTNFQPISSPEVKSYLRLIIAEIARNKVYPEEARVRNLNGIVIVKFKILRDGSVSQVEIQNTTADVILQKQAEAIVKKLDKKLPIPADIKTDSLSLNVPMNFSLN